MKKLIQKNILRLIIIFIITLGLMVLQTVISNAATTYTVTFDSNGGSAVPSQTVKAGECPTVPEEPTKGTLSFYVWLLDGRYIWNVNELTVTEDITLVAKWVTWFSIGTDENGSVGLSNEKGSEPSVYGEGFGGLVYEGDTQYYWAKPEDGYEFKEWQNQSDNTVYSKNNPIELKSGTTPGFQVRATFKESANPKFTVSFDSKGGSKVESQKIDKGSKAIKPSNPTKEGFEFENWYADESRTQVFDFNTPITKTTKIYAKWIPTTAVPFTVTFDTNGGSSIPSQEVYEGEKIIEPEQPTKEKLSFYVWTLNGSYVWDVDELEVTEDITLVANWVTWYTFDSGENGQVGSSSQKGVEPTDYGTGFGGIVYEGDTQYYWAKPNNGYVFKEWKNTSDNTTYSKSNPIVLKSGTTLGFNVKAIFEKEVPFMDVKEGSWYYNAVKYCYRNNIISGLNETSFGPSDKLTRGMMVTILYRMEGSPKITTTSNFTDVKDSKKYYYKATVWAANNKIVSGYENGRFGPGDNITREQLAVILYKYAKYKKKDVSKTNDLKAFSDANKVASYATKQVKWAVGAGVITGSNGKLNPKGNATRAEVAAMMEKYCKKVGR